MISSGVGAEGEVSNTPETACEGAVSRLKTKGVPASYDEFVGRMAEVGITSHGLGTTLSRSNDDAVVYADFGPNGAYVVIDYRCLKFRGARPSDAILSSLHAKATEISVRSPGQVIYKLPVQDLKVTGYCEVSFSLADGAWTGTLTYLEPLRTGRKP
jgi:hypothetical protein